MAAVAPLLETPLTERHRMSGARLIDFSGWQMPVQYTGIVEEHRSVRSAAGLFDLSHMGELWVSGPQAPEALAYALVTDPSRLAVGRAHYSMICAADGGIVDDLIVYRVAQDRFLVVPNAGNATTVASELDARFARFEVTLDDASRRTALIAVQGPLALEVLGPLTDADVASLKYYAMIPGVVARVEAWIARTGYTGEDGFELFLDWDAAASVWDRLLEAGQPSGLVPAGLGARDTLRLEAGMPLYGNDLDRDTDPFEAGLGRVVKLDKPGDFVGRKALEAIAASGPRKLLVGLVVIGRGIARHGYPVFQPAGHDPIGVVTSGTASPTLGQPIAMAYLPPASAEPGTMVEVGIRGGRVEARTATLPFYRRPSSTEKRPT